MYDGEHWILRDIEDALDQLFSDKSNILELKFEEISALVDESAKRMFGHFMDGRDENTKAIEIIKNQLKLLLYNYRHMIKK